MKKYNIYNKVRVVGLAAALLTLSLTSCDLDQVPYSEVTNEDFVKDDASVNTLLMGCYNGLHAVMEYEWAVTELRSDNSRMYGTGSTSNTTKLVEQLDQGTIGAEHDWVSSYWNACYATITRANNVLANLGVVSDETLRSQYEGEALFLRSLEYFNLVRLWGPVFIVTSKTPSDVARNMQRSTVEEVYALIEGDLEKVVDNAMLPEIFTGNNLGRADLTAAKALLAKVYATHYKLGDDKYVEAATLCNEVLQSVGAQSSSDLVSYEDIFSINNEMNKEIIFAVRYLSGSVGLGSPFGNMFAPLQNGANVIVGTANHYNTPSNNLIATYVADGDTKRLETNIAQSYYNKTTGATVIATYCKKYTNPVVTDLDGESDWPVIRVGDIALLYAELLNEINGPTQESLKYLNMIRERAGIALYSADELSNKLDFREAVRKERRMELAFENQRWFDLLRWGNATTTVNNYLASETFYDDYTYTVNPIEDWQVFLPVPISVLNINPDVAQNVGY